jgi:aminomethyltransferase
LIPAQNYSPFEIGLGRLVNFDKSADFVGRRALERESAAGGPARRLVGLTVDYPSIESLYEAQDLPVAVTTHTWREQRPVYAGSRQVGRATSGTWSPTLKQHIAIASLDPAFEPAGSAVALEWTVEGRRGRAAATVVPLPFFDPARKRA